MTKLQRVAKSTIVIFAAGVCTRAAASIYILSTFYRPAMLFIGNEPSHIAASLVSGTGFSSPYPHTPMIPTAQQPPLYPFILAGIFKVFGVYTAQSAWVIVSLHILAGGFTGVLIYRLGKVYFSETTAIVAAWLWVFPWMFQVRSFILSLTNAYFAALGFCALLLWVPKVQKLNRGWLLIGVYAGLLVLLQTSFLPVFAFYAICLAWSQARSRRMWLAAVGLIVVLAPWTVRNVIVMHRVVPIRDNFGLELWLGNRPGMHGTLDYSVDFPGIDARNYMRVGETRFMETKQKEAMEFIENSPGAFAVRCLRRVAEFWYEPYSVWLISLSILAWIGAALVWNRPQGWLFVMPLAVYPLVYYVTHMFAGYRYPIEPLIVLLAASALVELVTRVRHLFLEAPKDFG